MKPNMLLIGYEATSVLDKFVRAFEKSDHVPSYLADIYEEAIRVLDQLHTRR